MSRFSRFLSIWILVYLCLSPAVYGQKPEAEKKQRDPGTLIEKIEGDIYVPSHITKKPGHYTVTDWDDVIDETWGWGASRGVKLQIFDDFWDKIDQEFACFVDHPDYYPGWWDDMRDSYRPEIENGDPTYGVSRGRFAAILNYMSMALKESHTAMYDRLVNIQTQLNPGVPLLVVGAFGDNGHFGAGLTPLPDSSLLVYRTVPDHPLGLVPGDVVLGYDGIPWKDLYPELVEAQLPIYKEWWWGSCESAYTHSWLKAAGMNWHLFDIIDVAKYGTDDTLHLSVAPLIGQYEQLYCSEQMDIPGVPMPDYDGGISSTYGIIEGTQIGYIYAWDWYGNIESQFYEGVSELVNNPDIIGLILDYRMNYGGGMHLANMGYDLLFHRKIPGFAWDIRCFPSNHLNLCPSDLDYYHDVYASSNQYFDKPLAVLTGPGAGSAGDFNSLIMRSHPTARLFGKPATSAYNAPLWISNGYGYGYRFRYAEYNSRFKDDPFPNYLTRSELVVDEDVWLEPDDVAMGYDTVVETAKSWIIAQQGKEPDVSCDATGFEIQIVHGQAVTQELTVFNNGTWPLIYSLTPQIESGLRPIDNSGVPVASSSFPHNSDTHLSIDPLKNVHPSPPNPSDIILGHEGFDNYGHVWIDSEQPNGPSFDWVDISGIGTPVNLGDDSFSGPINLEFEFPFYENTYTELYICSNGFIMFGGGSGDYSNDEIPDPDPPNNIIAPWWDDLSPNMGGDVFYYNDIDNDRFILSFEGVPKYNYESFATFQVILYSSGQIEFNYVNLELEYDGFWDFYTATAGIENVDGSDGLQILNEAPYTIDNYSVLITTDWLAVEPYGNSIAPGESEIATVTFSAKHLPPGNYSGNIYLECNDPDEPSIVIPVSLEVTSGCDYIAGDCNHNGTPLELGDVVAMIGIYRGTEDPQYTCPCPPHADDFAPEADPNGNCIAFELGDVVTEIGAYRGTAEASGCPDCPGSRRLSPERPGNTTVLDYRYK